MSIIQSLKNKKAYKQKLQGKETVSSDIFKCMNKLQLDDELEQILTEYYDSNDYSEFTIVATKDVSLLDTIAKKLTAEGIKFIRLDKQIKVVITS